jgi:hypothetical protein
VVVRNWDVDHVRAALRWQAWHALFLTGVLSGLAVLVLPLVQALVIVVPLVLLSLAVLRKHGRRDPGDVPRNR